jgi:DNA-binding beta-propeller fold protein YncE
MSETTPPPEPEILSAGETSTGTATIVSPPGEAPEAPRNRRKLLIIIIAILIALLLIVGSIFVWFAITKKPLTQLPVLSSSIPPHYSATMYNVQQPIGVAVDEANDRVYVTQSAGDRDVAVFDTAGTQLDSLKGPGGEKAFHVPVYVAVDPTTSNVYVSDRATSATYVYDATGKFIKEFKPTGVKKWQPLGVWFDTDGNLYVTDVSAPKQKVLKVDPSGAVVQEYGADDGLSFPNGVATTAEGDVYVTDSNHSRVLMYEPTGKLIGDFTREATAPPLGLPRGITVDDRGRIYIVDTTNQDIQVFAPGDSPTGLPEYSYSFGEEGTSEGSFEYPNGIAIDSRSRLYITDRENNRLQVWSY